jgi:polyhydroxybutyrate depolymerase
VNWRLVIIPLLVFSAIVLAGYGSLKVGKAVWWRFTGHSSERIVVEGRQRRYELTVPPSAKPGPAPLVILLHGHHSPAKQMEGYLGFYDVAAQNGFAVAYPQGHENAWIVMPPEMAEKYPRAKEAAADMAFIDAVADDLIRRGIADKKRVYLAGVSNGGRMSLLIACQGTQKYAGIGVMIATMPALVGNACHPKPVPVIIMDGEKDPIFKWEGSQAKNELKAYFSAEDTAAFWRRVNGCSDAAVVRDYPHLRADDPSTVQSRLYDRCKSGKPVMLYKVIQGGHEPPSINGIDSSKEAFGQRNHDIDAVAEIWKFFSNASAK